MRTMNVIASLKATRMPITPVSVPDRAVSSPAGAAGFEAVLFGAKARQSHAPSEFSNIWWTRAGDGDFYPQFSQDAEALLLDYWA